jgi:hypothetical protein
MKIKTSRMLILLLLCFLIVAVSIPAVPAADASLTRGTMFTVTIAGKPYTDYYVWFAHTSALSGQPGNQPPVIVGNTQGVEFDPDGGPYVIGN